MAKHSIRNAGGVPFLTLRGHFVVRGKQQPDGDTVAFVAASKYKATLVETNVPVGKDGMQTANIRLQSIDAPEKSQRFGAASRNALLKRIGFDVAALGLSDTDFVAGGDPVLIPGWLATHGMDGNKRPLGYVYAKNPGFSHGKIITADDVYDTLKQSENFSQVSGGWAFPAFYSNTDESHAVVFAKAAARARKAKRGVWKLDATTTGFVPTKKALGAQGALVYPKFFRRIEDWKTAKPDANAFIAWLKKQTDGKKLVEGTERNPVPLWQLFEVVSTRKVAVPYDVTKLWFSE